MKKITNTSQNSRLDWLFGGNPDAIERQEVEGQAQLVTSKQLPAKVNSPRGIKTENQYKAMGIKVIGVSNDDDLFYDVEFPQDWKIEYTNHSMWSNLLDNKGRNRASIFYKASFYDREAFINFKNRIAYRVDRLGFLLGDYSCENGKYNSYKTPFVGRVMDYDGTVIFETKHYECDVEYTADGYGYTKSYCEKSEKIKQLLINECRDYLVKHYPDYADINAYWE